MEATPDLVAKLFDPERAGLTVALGLVKEMVTYNVIKRYGTVYKYGGREGINLGTSDDEAATWLEDTKNEDTVLTMKYNLDEKKGLV